MPLNYGPPVCPGTQDISLLPLIIPDPAAASIKKKVRLHSVSCNFHWADFSVEELRLADMQTLRRNTSVFVADLARVNAEKKQDTGFKVDKKSVIINNIGETTVLSDTENDPGLKVKDNNTMDTTADYDTYMNSAVKAANTEGAHKTPSTPTAVGQQGLVLSNQVLSEGTHESSSTEAPVNQQESSLSSNALSRGVNETPSTQTSVNQQDFPLFADSEIRQVSTDPGLKQTKMFPADIVANVNKRPQKMRLDLINEYEQKIKVQMVEHEEQILILKEKFARDKANISRDSARNAINSLESEVQKMQAMKEQTDNKTEEFEKWKIEWLREHKEEEERKFQAYRDIVERDCNKDLERAMSKVRADMNNGAASAFNELNNRCNLAMRRLDVVDNAATTTPNKPVKLVWKDATQLTQQDFAPRSPRAPTGSAAFMGDHAVERPVSGDSWESAASFRRRSSGSSRRSSSSGPGPSKKQRC